MEGKKKLICEIDNNPIDVEIRVDKSFKAIKYELTSNTEINPLDAAYCLWLIISNVCEEMDISVSEFLKNYSCHLPQGTDTMQ
jgi:hypothetical protein